jgi:hypothetical protein
MILRVTANNISVDIQKEHGSYIVKYPTSVARYSSATEASQYLWNTLQPLTSTQVTFEYSETYPRATFFYSQLNPYFHIELL